LDLAQVRLSLTRRAIFADYFDCLFVWMGNPTHSLARRAM
jgi:hypothetical protein